MKLAKPSFLLALGAVLALSGIFVASPASARPSFCDDACYPAAGEFDCSCPEDTRRYWDIVTCNEYWDGACDYFTQIPDPEDTRTGDDAPEGTATASVEPSEAPESEAPAG